MRVIWSISKTFGSIFSQTFLTDPFARSRVHIGEEAEVKYFEFGLVLSSFMRSELMDNTDNDPPFIFLSHEGSMPACTNKMDSDSPTLTLAKN